MQAKSNEQQASSEKKCSNSKNSVERLIERMAKSNIVLAKSNERRGKSKEHLAKKYEPAIKSNK